MDKSYRNSDLWLVMVLSTLLCARGDTGEKKSCTDSEGGVIPDGTNSFIPDYSDACRICVCDRGYPILCRTATCSPPPGCKQTKPDPGECCKFVCDDIPQPPSVDHNTTLDGTESAGDTGKKKSCTDSEGGVIPDGTRFIPDYSDACKTCVCDKGYIILCQTAACSPPDCKQTKPVPRECCKFVCEDIPQPPSVDHNTTLDGTESADVDNITNLSLRLVASTVTSFLVLALLLFMVHRLRQRRLMMAMRRFEAQAHQQRGDEDDLDHYIPAAFLHIECPPHEDPPPPYSPPKPPHILPEESPPPYQEKAITLHEKKYCNLASA